MRSYGQFCPVAKAAELFCERWNALIIRDLAGGPRRFSELQKGVPLMSPSLLSQRLKQLAAEDVLERRTDQENGFVYALTEAGQEFVPLVSALGVWGQRWTRRELQEHEIDLGLLVWSIESSAQADCFGARKCLIRLELSDQPESKRFWWFMNKDGECSLCVDDPGGGVDLFLACTLPDAIRVIRGDVELAKAIESGRLEALGEKWACDRLGDWLNLGPLTRIASRRCFTR
jgi:DNA-binding HxlR family transcriptional regulator